MSVEEKLDDHQEVSRKPNSRSALSSLRHSERTRTVRSRKTLMPKKRSRSVRGDRDGRKVNRAGQFCVVSAAPLR